MGLLYLPTFGLIFLVNVRKYTVHGSYGLYFFWDRIGPKNFYVNSPLLPTANNSKFQFSLKGETCLCVQEDGGRERMKYDEVGMMPFRETNPAHHLEIVA